MTYLASITILASACAFAALAMDATVGGARGKIVAALRGRGGVWL